MPDNNAWNTACQIYNNAWSNACLITMPAVHCMPDNNDWTTACQITMPEALTYNFDVGGKQQATFPEILPCTSNTIKNYSVINISLYCIPHMITNTTLTI